MTKTVAIWLAVLTILYVTHLAGDLLQARRLRALEARLKELESPGRRTPAP